MPLALNHCHCAFALARCSVSDSSTAPPPFVAMIYKIAIHHRSIIRSIASCAPRPDAESHSFAAPLPPAPGHCV